MTSHESRGSHQARAAADDCAGAPVYDEPEGDLGEDLSVGDPDLMKSRRLSAMCQTCVFRPGNRMHLHEGRLKDLVAQALAAQSYVVCHSTLPGMAPPGVRPAICRGFADRYRTQALQVIERLFGFVDVDPPAKPEG